MSFVTPLHLLWIPAPYRGTGQALRGKDEFRGAGLAAWYGEFARRILRRPIADPSGGQAPRLAKSSTALHFLIPPSTMGLQFGRVRRWRAGIGVEWRAHPGSESGTCFRTDCPCRVVPEQVARISAAIHVPVGHERDNLLSECCFEFLAALLASSSTGERRLFQPTASGRLIVQPLLHIILAWPRAWRVRWERQTNREGPGVSATRWSPMRGTSRVCNSLRVGLQA